MKRKNYILLAVGLLAMVWPLVYNQLLIGCGLPSDCSDSRRLPLIIAISSTLFGAYLAAYNILTKITPRRQRVLFSIATVTISLALIDFVIYFILK